jgi:hypothetical protein
MLKSVALAVVAVLGLTAAVDVPVTNCEYVF